MRPRSIEEMQEVMSGFASEEGVAIGLAYKPDPSDIFISPFAKCGTTWMQQIVHGLRSQGSMAFSEITEVVPWLEMAHDMGIDIHAPQVAGPRAFKSHLAYDAIPKGARYIIVLRDPVDAMVSLFNFFEGWIFEPGSITLDDFADYYLGRPAGRNYWDHAASWWRQRDNPCVLLLTYEAMKRDHVAAVERVANFMDPDISTGIRALASAQSTFEFMKAHDHQFDDHLIRQARDAACGLPPGGQTSKVKSGQSGQGKALVSDAIKKNFATRWQATMAEEFGLASYDALIAALEH